MTVSSEFVLEQLSKVLKLHEKLMYAEAAHKNTSYICSISKCEKALFGTEISIKRIHMNCVRFTVCVPRNIPEISS
jgi:hypothetical protein